MKSKRKETILVQLRRENPTQYKTFVSLLLTFYALELANYLAHASGWSLLDYSFYMSLYNLPFFEEVTWMVESDKFASYANAYAEYMVWGVGLYGIICAAWLIALFNIFCMPPLPKSLGFGPSALGYKIIGGLTVLVFLLGFFTIVETNHFNGKGIFSGLHISIPTFFISIGRVGLFTWVLPMAIPAITKMTKKTF